MASDRGPYRAIPGILLDGPDFQQLPERARTAFLAMKINFGPSGIEVQYPQALAATIACQMGMPFDAALEHSGPGGTLHRDGWIEWEDNVCWIVGQLEFEPNMNASDPKHRKSIQRHMMGLPRRPIIARFIAAYPDWFPADEFTPPEGLARPIEGPSKPLATTEDREPKTEDREPKTEDGGAAPLRRSTPKSKSNGKRWRTCPEDWAGPNDEHRARATELGLDLEREERLFRSHEFDRPKLDPDRTFTAWIERAAGWGETKRGRQPDDRPLGAINGADQKLTFHDAPAPSERPRPPMRQVKPGPGIADLTTEVLERVKHG